MKKATGIIPARFESTRFPGKPLVTILGKPLLQWVYENALRATLLENLIIATDDDRIFSAAKRFGAKVIMTSTEHRSGTERAAEVAKDLNSEIIINIQGDEPLIKGEMIDLLISSLENDSIQMATLAKKSYDLDHFKDKNTVKVVLDHSGYALYFSRTPIPFGRTEYYWKHIGIYGYQRDFLCNIKNLKSSELEAFEKLEQLKILENGFKIKVIETNQSTISIDSREDIIKVEKLLKKEDG